MEQIEMLWDFQQADMDADALENDIPQGDSFSGVLIGPKPVAVPLTKIGADSAATCHSLGIFARQAGSTGGSKASVWLKTNSPGAGYSKLTVSRASC